MWLFFLLTIVLGAFFSIPAVRSAIANVAKKLSTPLPPDFWEFKGEHIDHENKDA